MQTKDLKIAFLGVSHWHVPLYFPALEQEQVIAVSDPTAEQAEKFAAQLGCPAYSDWRKLLDEQKPDFVFAFARHCDMKEMALELIRRGMPFAMEKPMGMSCEEVREIAEAAEAAHAFCAIPFVWRYSDTVSQLKNSLLKGKILHMSYRFIAGPPSRYLVSSPWMLSKETAGGGCMTNLGVHFIDMALYLTDSSNAEVLASSYQYQSDYDIEIYASSLLNMESGASLTLETGYAYPMDEQFKRENRWCIVTENGYYTLAENALEAREFDTDPMRISLSTDSDVYYPQFVEATLDDYINGRCPRASIQEMLTVRSILDRMDQAAETKK